MQALPSVRIDNARLLDPATGGDATGSLHIVDGRIAALGDLPPGLAAQHVIDARGRALLPGLIDLSARLPGGLPGSNEVLRAAARGGVTSLVLPAWHGDVALVDAASVRAACSASAPGQPRVLACGLLHDGETRRADPAALAGAGALAGALDAALPRDARVLRWLMQDAAQAGLPLWVRPHDPRFGTGVVAAGAYATRLGLPGVPLAAETQAVQLLLALQRETGIRLHLARLSSEAAVALVRQGRAEGLSVTCDVSTQHLHLAELDIGFYDAHCHLRPPLRGQRDRAALADGLADGTISALCSDHTVLGPDDKIAPFAETAPGAAGVGLLFSLALKWARDSRLPLARALACVTSGPASVAGLAAGRLQVGAPADLCLADLDAEWFASADALGPQNAVTPFAGMMLPGRVCAVWVGGHLAWEIPS
ncbi:amidohydrolase family protein [Pseudomonadota bacterium AL_CKDN230030165-1A_HGKHYDSX7]